MTDTPSPRRSRSRVAERAQHLYTARAEEYSEGLTHRAEPQARFAPNEPDAAYGTYASGAAYGAYTPNEIQQPEYASYTPNEPEDEYAGYTPNEEAPLYAGYTPNEPEDEYTGYPPNEEPQVDYAAYYSREGTAQENEAESAFAPPPSMQQYTFEAQPWPEEPEEEAADYAAATVYRPREATWADDVEREEALAESEQGYQVQEEEQTVRKKRHVLRTLLIVLLVLALLGGAAWLMRDRLTEMLGITVFISTPTETPIAAATPEPVRAYDAAPVAAIAEPVRDVIDTLRGTLEMEDYIVTDQHVVTRNQRPDGSYDFYLFTAAEGRLLCYFEGLDALDMIPQENGRFYVKQSPWLITPGGAALIRTSDIEAALNESVFLHPMYNGWAVVESLEDGHATYVNADGQVLSSLWFCRLFPFTGEHTLAYVDTGSTADADDRYLLYVVGRDGGMTRWLAAADTQEVTACVCGMAYMSDGSLYQLPDTAAAVVNSPEVTAYLDCDAMVIRDPETGKYGLFVHGEQHYAFEYDAIHPLESDIVWAEKTFENGASRMTVKAVNGATYPQPLSYSFVLEKEGQTEYVALSTQSSYPIRLDGEF